jgi:hypothetical protein
VPWQWALIGSGSTVILALAGLGLWNLSRYIILGFELRISFSSKVLLIHLSHSFLKLVLVEK